jgi:hypothetical protein
MTTMGNANVSLPYPDLVQLIGELDARAHDLDRFADEARRHHDSAQVSRHLEHRNEVLRLREYLHGYLRATVTAARPGGASAPAR